MDIDKMYSEIKPKFGFDLKDEQKKILKAILDRRDVSAVLPTGYGKSLCYVLPPLLLDQTEENIKHLAIVASPLISLMKDQIENLNRIGIKGVMITHENKFSTEELCSMDASLVFITPEALQSNFVRRLFLKKDLQERICLLACDEAHCVSDWGEDFRPEFRQVATVRSTLDVPVLALTATATEDVQKDICNYLLLDDDALSVAVIPNRENIFIDIQKCTQDYETEMQWLIQYFQSTTEWKKTIIFCRSYTIVYNIWSWMIDTLGEKAFNGERNIFNRKIVMFHSSTDSDSKERILNSFTAGDSSIRVLVATVAFGMGINIPDIDIVINWGSSKSILSYWQEVGRAGRSGRPAFAVMYAYPRSLIKTITSGKMIEICRTDRTSCITREVLRGLLTSSMREEELPLATANCDKKCELCICKLCTCCTYCATLCECSGHIPPRELFFL